MNTTDTDIRQHILDTAKPIMLRKGFSGVGLNEILAVAGVPKGSFYYYFSSKEAFGQAVLESHFADYLAYIDNLFERSTGSAAERLMHYWRCWQQRHESDDPAGKCLVVKLGAEVCDLSETMRTVIKLGTAQIIKRLATCIEAGLADGSLTSDFKPRATAEMLYQLWLGATLVDKIRKDGVSLSIAMTTTQHILNLPEQS